MQYSISHLRPSRLALCIAVVALSLLLIPAALADADSLTAPVVAEENPATSAEPAPPAAAAQPASSTSTSAPSEAASAAGPSAQGPAGGQQSSPPVSPAGPAQTSTDSSSTAASEIGRAASKVAAVAASTVQDLPLQAQPDSAVLPTDQVTNPVPEMRRGAAATVKSATAAAKTAARGLGRASPIDRVHSLAHAQLQKVTGALRNELDRFAPAIPQIPSLAAGGDGPTSEAPPALLLPSTPSPASAGGPPLERIVPVDVRLRPSTAAPGDAAFLRLLTPNAAGHTPGGPGLAPAADPNGLSLDRLSLDRLEQHVDTSPPPADNGPAPIPDLPQLIASGASSSFVQIAALLALLALAAPAILRWLREVPGFRAPTPFVCALERPG